MLYVCRNKRQSQNVQEDKHRRFKEPPFKVNVNRFTRIDKHRYLDEDTGEIKNYADYKEIKDSKIHTKVYKQFYWKAFSVDKLSTLKVILYIQLIAKKDTMYVVIKIKDCCEATGLSQKTYSNAITELIEKDFIANAEQVNKYWINAELFYNGKRENNKGRD